MPIETLEKKLFSRRDIVKGILYGGAGLAVAEAAQVVSPVSNLPVIRDLPVVKELNTTAEIVKLIPKASALGSGPGGGMGGDLTIAPALIVPDCSRAEYLSSEGLPRTALGQQKESTLGPYTDEWCDTYESVLLPSTNPDNVPLSSKTYFRPKYGDGRFQCSPTSNVSQDR